VNDEGGVASGRGVSQVANPDGRRWRAPAIWWPFAIGLVFLLFAATLEHGLWIAEGKADGSKSLVFHSDALIVLSSELGYAFIIAWVVSYFIEAGARREQNEAFERSMSEISRNVFAGVFRIRHEPEYVQAVVTNCLETRLVREGYDINYTVDAFTPEQEAEFGLDPGRFVQVTGAIRYRARNVGTYADRFTTSYTIPTRSGKLTQLSALLGLRVGHKLYSEQDRSKLRVPQPANGHPTDLTYRFEFDLEPNESKEILIEAVLVKERSDSETFGFGMPTMDASVRLNMNVPGLRFGGTPRIIGKWREVRSPENGRSGEWKVDHPILPYNSVILWWRSAEDDGALAALPGRDDAEAIGDDSAGAELPLEPGHERGSDADPLWKRGVHRLESFFGVRLRGKKASDKS
jgi:hypothetical protein